MAVDLTQPSAQDAISLAELALWHAITDWRAALGLPAVPLSKALSATAGRHVLDTRENIWEAGLELPAGTNLHSWSDAYYYADGSTPEAMWFAPRRLGTGFDAPAYEITGAGYADGDAALAGWEASPPHRAVIANTGPWVSLDWQAIGVGLETAPGAGTYAGRIYHVWFSDTADASGPPAIVGTTGADTIAATPFADTIVARWGDDRIWAGGGDDNVIGGGGDDRIWAGGGDDTLRGEDGADVLFAVAGRNRLLGGDGNDVLVAGSGDARDWLAGGQGADLFRFLAPAPVDAATGRDVVADFGPSDRLDLRPVDARPDLPGDQAFVLADSAGPGTLVYAGGILTGHLDDDGRADFEILLAGAPVLAPGDVLL